MSAFPETRDALGRVRARGLPVMALLAGGYLSIIVGIVAAFGWAGALVLVGILLVGLGANWDAA